MLLGLTLLFAFVLLALIGGAVYRLDTSAERREHGLR